MVVFPVSSMLQPVKSQIVTAFQHSLLSSIHLVSFQQYSSLIQVETFHGSWQNNYSTMIFALTAL